MITVGEYVSIMQPHLIQQLRIRVVREDELTPYQEYLERLMRQRPRPGGGSAWTAYSGT